MIENKNDFTQGSIFSKLLRFMIPILGALVLQAMYGAVDILVVGQFGTTAGISGVSTGSNIVNLITFTITGLTMGVTVVMGQYMGQKKTERVGMVVGGAICLFLVLAVIIAAAMLLFARPLAVLMQSPEEALDLTILYVRICGGGVFFIMKTAIRLLFCLILSFPINRILTGMRWRSIWNALLGKLWK